MSSFKSISFIISSLGSGGAERVVCNLTNELIDRGYLVSIILVVNNNINYYISNKAQLIFLNCADDYSLSWLKRYRTRIRKIKKAINDINPDIVISFMSETNIDTAIAMCFNSKTLIVSERNDPKIDPSSRVKRFIRRIAYFRPQGFVFQTPDAKNYFSKAIQLKSTIILNPLVDRLPNALDKKENYFVAVGRLNPQKNYKLLIDAFKEFSQVHKEYTLHIYGDGPDKEIISKYIFSKDLSEKVLLKGFSTNVHSQIANSKGYFLTSDFEGMPNALIEAMAMGLPCVSTDCPCGGPRYLIKNNYNGFLIPLGSKSAVLEAMEMIDNNPELASQCGENAKKIYDLVNSKTITNQWIKFMESIY